MSPLLNDLAARAGVRWFDHQLEFLQDIEADVVPNQRALLHFKTGSGKSITSLAGVAAYDHKQAVVVAPPSTHDTWVAQAQKLDIELECMSHARFRMKDTKLSRNVPLIVDEFHMLGGHGAGGFSKLDRLAPGIKAPLILASATPNYNDAERVYCIQHVLAPETCRGGYIEFLYQECNTKQNPFGKVPLVMGKDDGVQPFRRFPDAASYLESLPGVYYLPDDLVWSIEDIEVVATWPHEIETYGYNARRHRVIASGIEERHTRVDLALIGDDGLIRPDVYDVLEQLVGNASTPVLIFANHSTVAEALAATLRKVEYGLVTGKTSQKMKQFVVEQFRKRKLDVLIGTASLATGTDGLDKVSDTLVILDDTDDDSLRRQLVGRIMPRGEGGDASTKSVYRIVPT